MKIIKSCSVKFRPEGIYICSYANTAYGLFANTPFSKLNTDVAAAPLGAVLLDLLRSVPDQFIDLDLPSWRKHYLDHLRSLGFKSDKAFAKNAVSLSVKIYDGEIAVVPYELVPRGGYVPLVEKTKNCHFDAEAVGKLVFEQRLQCK